MCGVNGPSWVLRYPISRARCLWLACVYSSTIGRRCVLAYSPTTQRLLGASSLLGIRESAWTNVPWTGASRLGPERVGVEVGRLLRVPAAVGATVSLGGQSRWCNSLLRGSLGECNSLSHGWSSAGNSLAVRKSGRVQQSHGLALARARATVSRSGGRPRAIASRFGSRVACNSLASRRSFGRVQQSRARAAVRVQQSRGSAVGSRATVSRLG